MRKMQSSKLQYEIAQRIIDLCRMEDYPTGHRLTERYLAERFEVSRSPIRLALEMLASKGVISRTPSGGYLLNASGRDLEMQPVELPQTAAETLHQKILRDRFTNRIPHQITEADLLRRYPVTRGVLLKVLMRLSQEGIVYRSQGHGWIFLEMLNSVETHKASYEFRLAIEPQAIRSPNFKIDHHRVERLLEIHTRLRDGEIPNMTGTKQFDLDAELHETIAAFSGNEFFLKAVQRHNQLRRVAEYESFYASERMHESHEEHVQILEALRDEDIELAATLMARHLHLASRSIGIFQPRNGSDSDAPAGAKTSVVESA